MHLRTVALWILCCVVACGDDGGTPAGESGSDGSDSTTGSGDDGMATTSGSSGGGGGSSTGMDDGSSGSTTGVDPACVETPKCDPLDANFCSGDLCIPSDGSFACHPPIAGPTRGDGEPCDSNLNCEIGLTCVAEADVTTCDAMGLLGCCRPYCDLDTPTCADCTQVPQAAPTIDPCYVHVGYCP